MKQYYKYLMTVVFTLIFIIPINAQIGNWTNLGNGSSGAWSRADIVHNNEVHRLMQDTSYSRMWIAKWNGTVWLNSPSKNTSGFYPGNLRFVNDSAYVLRIRIINGWEVTMMDCFNGTSWEQNSDTVFNDTVLSGERIYASYQFFDNKLHVIGRFHLNGGIQNIAYWDGSKLVGKYNNLNGLSFKPRSIYRFNNELYLAGRDTVGAPVAVRKRNNSTGNWEQVAQNNQGSLSFFNEKVHLFQHAGNLYLIDSPFPASQITHQIYHLRNDSLIPVYSLGHYLHNTCNYKGNLYLGGLALNTSNSGLTVLKNQTFSSIPNVTGDVELVLATDSNLFFVMFGLGDVMMQTKGLSFLNGVCFRDTIANCVNNNEPIFPNLAFTFGNGLTGVSNLNGQFSISLFPGTYHLDSVHSLSKIGKNLVNICPKSQSLVVMSDQNYYKDIAMEISELVDAQVSITGFTGFRVRHGSLVRYKIDVSNAGSTTINNITLTVKTPSTIQVANSAPSYDYSFLNQLGYTLTNIKPLETRSIILDVNIDPQQNNLGDQLQWEAIVVGVNGENDLSDNKDTLIQTVVSAYDPNDKRPSDKEITPSTKSIDYHIRFQNTGNDTAQKVIVIDTLELSLPINKVIINSASHPYVLRVENNVLIWEFDNILLPDSTTDPLGSQGFIRFTAGVNSALIVGDTIKNDAQIFFDYQKPIYTNNAKTVIIEDFSLNEENGTTVQAEVFPNPGTGILNLKSNSKKAIKFEIIDGRGSWVDEIMIPANGEAIYDASLLKSGLYFLRSEKQVLKMLIR